MNYVKRILYLTLFFVKLYLTKLNSLNNEGNLKETVEHIQFYSASKKAGYPQESLAVSVCPITFIPIRSMRVNHFTASTYAVSSLSLSGELGTKGK